MYPRVSILIPCFNAERWIAKAIDSALAQTWPNCEVIVIDDGSTDSSLEIIQKYSDRIVWETGPNRGGNVTRNRLLLLSHGDWLQYLDADDWLEANKIADHIDFLQHQPDADVIFGPVTLEHWTKKGSRFEPLPIPEPHDPWILLARWYLPQTGAALWRGSAIQDVSGWNEGQTCCQEHELYLRLLIAGKRFAYHPQGGAVYRQWGEHTVCKQDKPEVRRRRLEIECWAEAHLLEHKQLSMPRRTAINQARFELARMEWQDNRVEAMRIIEQIRLSQPEFVPSGGAAPPLYRTCHRLLGFRLTETLADFRRQIQMRFA